MLVSYEHDFVFLATRETGALRVDQALEQFCVPPGASHAASSRGALVSDYGIVGERGVKRRTSLGRVLSRPSWRFDSPATAVRRKVGRAFWDGATKISVVRNPFDRMVAMFYRAEPRPAVPRPSIVDLRREFREFLLSVTWDTDRDIVFDGREFAPEVVLEHETLEEDFEDLLIMLGLPTDTDLPEDEDVFDLIMHYDVPEYYDAASISCVLNRLAWVFERFDYPKEPVRRARRTPPVPRSTLI